MSELSEAQRRLLQMTADDGGRLEAPFAVVHFTAATVRAAFRKGLIDGDMRWLMLTEAGRKALETHGDTDNG
jgi:hypothetical protein